MEVHRWAQEELAGRAKEVHPTLMHSSRMLFTVRVAPHAVYPMAYYCLSHYGLLLFIPLWLIIVYPIMAYYCLSHGTVRVAPRAVYPMALTVPHAAYPMALTVPHAACSSAACSPRCIWHSTCVVIALIVAKLEGLEILELQNLGHGACERDYRKSQGRCLSCNCMPKPYQRPPWCSGACFLLCVGFMLLVAGKQGMCFWCSNSYGALPLLAHAQATQSPTSVHAGHTKP